jgi:hypothetical protein
LQGAGTPTGTLVGKLAGIPGTLTLVQPTPEPQYQHHADDYYLFTRTTAGTATPVTRPEPLLLDNAQARRNDIQILWYGRNNHTATARVLSDIEASVQYLTPAAPRFLVLAVCNGLNEGTGTATHTSITGLNAQLLAKYGRRFVDIRSYLIKYGLADAGITPTSQDTTDMAADTIPASLRVDSVHFTAAGYTVVGNLVAKRLKEMGWA